MGLPGFRHLRRAMVLGDGHRVGRYRFQQQQSTPRLHTKVDHDVYS